ncbi:MAG: hypothetical protein Q9167_001485 [Letrouitia subvulpina]
MVPPVQEIPRVIHLLTQSPPSLQRATLEKYFTPSASFTHPFCRTGSFEGSRWLIWCIYRWYKIMSPRIELKVDGVAFDEKNLALYVSLHQTFRIFLVPFFAAHVYLTTVLKLVRLPPPPPPPQASYTESMGPYVAPNDGIHRDQPLKSEEKRLYYIRSQNDLYQVNELFKFFSPLGIVSGLLVLWQLVSTGLCVLGAAVFWPVSWVEENVIGGNRERGLGDAVRG